MASLLLTTLPPGCSNCPANRMDVMNVPQQRPLRGDLWTGYRSGAGFFQVPSAGRPGFAQERPAAAGVLPDPSVVFGPGPPLSL